MCVPNSRGLAKVASQSEHGTDNEASDVAMSRSQMQRRRPETPRPQSATAAACAPLPALRATLQHIFPHLDREST